MTLYVIIMTYLIMFFFLMWQKCASILPISVLFSRLSVCISVGDLLFFLKVKLMVWNFFLSFLFGGAQIDKVIGDMVSKTYVKLLVY